MFLNNLNVFLSYLIDSALLINLIGLFIIVSRLRWINALLFAIVFYIAFALFLINTGVDFIGILYFIIYLGAIMTLFLFAIMFLHARTRFNSGIFTSASLAEFEDFWAKLDLIFVSFRLVVLLLRINFWLWLDAVQPWAYTFSFLYKDTRTIKQTLASYHKTYVNVLKQLEDLFAFNKLGREVFIQKFNRFCSYAFLFLSLILTTQIFDINASCFGFYSEEIFYYLGSILELLRGSLFLNFQLEFILIGLTFWAAFICVLALLHKKK